MRRALFSAYLGTAALLLAGCETLGTAPATVKAAVAEAPCKVSVPVRPVFPADTLTGDEDEFTLGTVLWADRKAREAYQLQLETIVKGCTAPPAVD